MNEPNTHLKIVSSRVDVHLFAAMMQYCDEHGVTMADAIRESVADKFGTFTLSDEWSKWVDDQIGMAVEKRKAAREERKNRRKRSLLRMLFRK